MGQIHKGTVDVSAAREKQIELGVKEKDADRFEKFD